jgi:hypothetical protein
MSPLLTLTTLTITVRDGKGGARTVRAPECRSWILESAGQWGELMLTAELSGTLDAEINVTQDDPEAEVRRLREALRALCDDIGDRLAASYCATSYEAARAALADSREAP